MLHKIAIITVVYRNYSILEDFLASFKRQTNRNFRIYICDQSENPHSITQPPFVTVMHSKNLGYAHGINICLKTAMADGYDKFCVINSDTTVSENFVEKLQNRLTKMSGSIIGGKIYYYPGYEYHKKRYTSDQRGAVIWYAGGFIDWQNVDGIHRGVDQVDERKYRQFEKTDFITGCLMSFDKSVLNKIGFWDENYFLYFEDADYCVRARKIGINLYYDPEIIIWHKNAQSTEGSGSDVHQKYQRRSRLKFGL